MPASKAAGYPAADADAKVHAAADMEDEASPAETVAYLIVQ